MISPYFNHAKDRGEQSLFEDLLIETIQMSGVDVYYLPATRDIIDPILGESVRTTFKQMVVIEVYMPQGGGSNGEGELMSKFGYAQRDSMDLMMSKRRFTNQAEKAGLDLLRPREGDLIFIGDIDAPYASQVNQIYEITYVSFQEAEWSFGKAFAYKLSISSFAASHEKFETLSPLDITMPATLEDMEGAINTAVQETKQTLLRFDKRNPLANI